MGVVTRAEMSEFVDLVRPRAMAATAKVRLGGDHDGGYVMAATALGCDALLSIGIGWDVSFDLEFAERGARVLQFDHTLPAGYTPGGVSHPNFELHRLGWGPHDEGPLLGLASMTALLDRRGPWLRGALSFDVEGAEYAALAATDTDLLARFDVIACELHDWGRLGDRAFFAGALHGLRVLATHHEPVHLHANNNRGTVTVAGVTVPEVVEISYLRRDLDGFPGYSTDPMPGPLDAPNNPYLPDLRIRLS